jgi:outer membrane immunogenic protein
MKIAKLAASFAMGLAAAMGGSKFARSADLPYPAPIPAPVYAPVFSWTGLYIGGSLGGAWSPGTIADTVTGTTFSNLSSSLVFVGGGQVGVNYQTGYVVLGAEANFNWVANNGYNNNGVVIGGPLGLGDTFTATANNRWITTVTGRLGVTADRVLFYAKAGAGWVGRSDFTVTDLTAGLSVVGSNNRSSTAWTVGAGVEWALPGNWIVRAEYDYIGLNNQSFNVPLSSPVLPGDSLIDNRNIALLTVGVSYLFSWGTPVAPPY